MEFDAVLEALEKAFPQAQWDIANTVPGEDDHLGFATRTVLTATVHLHATSAVEAEQATVLPIDAWLESARTLLEGMASKVADARHLVSGT